MPADFFPPPSVINSQSVPPELETTPPLPTPRPRHTSLLPLFLGVIVVFFVAGIFGSTYYLSQLKKELATSPTPIATPTPIPDPSLEPSLEPSPSASTKAKATPKSTPKPTAKPTTTTVPTASTTPTVTLPNLDIRFGNPAANVKQTIDEGAGDGRVINREYTSIQIGEFDEVKSSYSPRVTVCFHIVSNEDLAGDKVGYTLTLDDQIKDEGTLSQYDKLETGRLYDLCRDLSSDLGTHVVKLNINNAKSLSESNFNNNYARLEYKNLADNIAPNFTLAGPFDWDDKGTCFTIINVSDNVANNSDLKLEQKIDNGSWETTTKADYCATGTAGTSRSYSYRITDPRGNKNEQSKSFTLF